MKPLERRRRCVEKGFLQGKKDLRLGLTSGSEQDLKYFLCLFWLPSNKLVNSDVWAVHTDGGHLVKVLVISYGYNIVLDYVVYDYWF